MGIFGPIKLLAFSLEKGSRDTSWAAEQRGRDQGNFILPFDPFLQGEGARGWISSLSGSEGAQGQSVCPRITWGPKTSINPPSLRPSVPFLFLFMVPWCEPHYGLKSETWAAIRICVVL